MASTVRFVEINLGIMVLGFLGLLLERRIWVVKFGYQGILIFGVIRITRIIKVIRD